MMKFLPNLLLLFILLITGCNVEQQPIRYGEEICQYCTMTIVEPGFGAEVVTNKGKAYKFDAIECMMNYLEENGDDDIALFFSNILIDPGSLFDATGLTFLKAESIPSPMGAFLSAYSSVGEAKSTLGENEGEIYNWDELREYFDKNSR